MDEKKRDNNEIVLKDSINNKLTKRRRLQLISTAKIKLLLQQIPVAMILSLLVSFFVYFELKPSVWGNTLNYWLAIMIGLSLSLMIIPILFLKFNYYLKIKNSLIIITALMTLLGLTWGTIGFIFINDISSFQQAFIIMIIFGLAGGAMPVLSVYIQVYLLFCFPVLVPFIIHLSINPEYGVVWPLSVFIYLLVLIGSSYYIYKSINRFLNIKSENINLDSLNKILSIEVKKRTKKLDNTLILLRSILESTADGILVVDRNGKRHYFNQQLINMWDVKEKKIDEITAADELIPFIREHVIHHYSFLKKLAELREKTVDTQKGEIKLKNQKIFEWYSSPYWMKGDVSGRVWSFRDITQRKKMEARLRFQANFDLLTQLPNQQYLKNQIMERAAAAKRSTHFLIALFIDINNFKIINDNFGYEMGDQILKIIARRLKHAIRKSDLLARFGSDEFVVLMTTNNLQNIYEISMKFTHTISKPIKHLENKLIISAKMGASVYPLDDKDPGRLLRNASVALNHAKRSGGQMLKIYEPHLDKQYKNVLEIQAGIQQAIQEHQIFMEYQPIFDLKSKKIVSAEALCRWRQLKGNVVYPVNFIKVAEQTGIIVELGEHIFRLVIDQTKDLFSKYPDIKIAINISVLQLLDSSFPQKITGILQAKGIKPENIEIEITESAMMENQGDMISIINQMHEVGFQFVIDDFGTGYSSLGYINNLPISKIKIDRSFTTDCYWDGHSASIVKTIINMAHDLSIPVIAEGVELKEELEFLIKNNCDQGQGFFLSTPIAYDKLIKLLKK